MTWDPSNRIQVTKELLYPMKCRICNRGSDGKLAFIDFALSLPGPSNERGAVNFCTDCCINIGQAFGMVLAGVHESLREDFDALTQVVQEQSEKLDNANRGLATVRDMLNSGDLSSVFSDLDAADDETDAESDDSESTGSDSSTGNRLAVTTSTDNPLLV